MLHLWLRCHSIKKLTCHSTCLLKLFHVHLAITIQIKHLKGDFKIPLGSYIKRRKKNKNKNQRPVNEDTKAQQKKKKKAQVQKDFIQKQFSIILAILIRKCRSWEPLPTSFIVFLLPKVSARRLGGDVSWTKFIPFAGGKSTKSRHYLICLMTINRKWHCSKTSSLLHTVQYQFGQRTFSSATEDSPCFVKQPVGDEQT